MYKKILWAGFGSLIIGFSVFAVLANFNRTEKNVNEKMRVVTTLFPLYDFAKNIGGEKVDVLLLLPPGVEPHGFEPKPSDIVKINEADLFVYTGKFMETWAEDIIKGISNESVKIVDSSNGIELAKGDDGEEEDGHHHEGLDPHIWLGFDNAQIMVYGIAKAMAEKDPDNANHYFDNAAKYNEALAALDSKYRGALEKCESREIIYGGHYAFGYMARRYGLTYVAAQGFSPDSEPTANDMVALVRQIKDKGIKYIFYEELSSPKIAQILASETNAQMLLLNGAHNLAKEDYEASASFISLMEQNLDNLSLGLGCSK